MRLRIVADNHTVLDHTSMNHRLVLLWAVSRIVFLRLRRRLACVFVTARTRSFVRLAGLKAWLAPFALSELMASWMDLVAELEAAGAKQAICFTA